MLLTTLTSGWSQSQDVATMAMDHIKKNAKAYQLESSDIDGMIITDIVPSTYDGGQYVYISQAYQGIPIYNAISTVAIKDQKVIATVNNFHSKIAERVKPDGSRLSPSQTLGMVASELGVAGPKIQEVKAAGDKVIFAGANISREEIEVKPMYQMNDAGELVLCYDMAIASLDNPDYLSVRADIQTGEIVHRHNWTVYCNHNHTAGRIGRYHDCSNHTAKTIKTEAHPPMTAASGAYRVYALPAESPIHGEYVLVTNPHDPGASPFGWHDVNGVEGAEFTITRGNNVYAYLDTNDDNTSDGGEPDGGDALVFDYVHDLLQEPDQSLLAAQTNLFYMNNMMHDLFFDYSFDERSGNFQQRNYGTGGQPSDHVLAEALDGSGTNNANFSTPPDGGNGRMQMFLWDNPSGVLAITNPIEISGVISQTGRATDWSAQIDLENIDITAPVAIGRDGSGNPLQGCNDLVNGDELMGNIAMIDRGLCDFSQKAFRAQEAGAVALLISNVPGVNGGTGEEIINMSGGDFSTEVDIPVLFMRASDANLIKNTINSGTQVFVRIAEIEAQGASQLDASFDNGVIAHEYGHGISNRLTGGPSQAGCLGNGEQMGEGWSDFFSLVTTVRDGDVGETPRGIGTFVDAQPASGVGIRQFPYSTDMSINPDTYDDVVTSNGVHRLGSIWCAMLWDLYWAMVDVYGYDSDWSNMESGNARAIMLVMEGMKMQGCSPGFIQGRDGILRADDMLYGGENELLIWQVFARRGLGFLAEGGSTDSSIDGVEDFSLPPLLIEELKITRNTEKDLLKPGEITTVTLNVVNHIPSQQEGVFVIENLQEGLSFVENLTSTPVTVNGGELRFDIGSMPYQNEVEIQYTVMASTEIQSQQLFFDDFDDDLGWTEEDLEGSGFTWFLDDVGLEETSGWGAEEVDLETDQVLVSPPIQVTGEFPVLRFWHLFSTNRGNNGGFVQISDDGGNRWLAITADQFIRNPYRTPLVYGLFAIPALDGFSGYTDEEFIDSYIDLSDYKGKTVQVRFRFGTQPDVTPSEGDFPGWFVDDVELLDIKTFSNTACVNNNEGQQNCAMESIIVDNGLVNVENVDNAAFGLEVFPNPTTDRLTVTLSQPAQDNRVSISLMSIDGQEVMRSDRRAESRYDLKVGEFPAGTYILGVKIGQQQTMTKVIIQ